MMELTELVWETEIGGLVVGVDESRCVVLRWEYPQHTVSDIQALIEALEEARRHVACCACGSDLCICADLQEQAEAEQAKFEPQEIAYHEEWLASRLCDSCGLDHCQCDRYFAEQNADYEGLVY